MRPPTKPFDHGTIFTVLNLHGGLQASGSFARLRRQARLSGKAGLDGVCLSEHHGDFPGYLPVPLQSLAVLAADVPGAWIATSPLLVGLRSVASVVEEAAWLHAAYPGRVGLGLAVGYLKADFDIYSVPFEKRAARFREMAPELVKALRGEASDTGLRGDPAVCEAAGQIPVALNTGGPRHCKLAAELGAALVAGQRRPTKEFRGIFRGYVDVGGDHARILQRWVYLGQLPTDLVDSLNRQYASRPGDHTTRGAAIAPWVDADPARLAERLVEWVELTEATALAVRFHIGDLDPDAVDNQIARFGDEVLPLVRSALRPSRDNPGAFSWI